MNKNKGVFFSCIGMTEYENKIWFAARETNGLFRMGLQGECLEYRGSFPNEAEDKSYLYGSCVLHEENIIFAPYLAEEIAVYDIKKEEFHKYSFDENICNARYLSLATWKDEVIFLPAKNSNKVIIRMNIKNGDIRYINDWQDKFIIDESEENLFFDYCIKENILYAPVISSQGQIMKYNLDTHEISCIQLDEKNFYRAICCDGKNFYLCSQIGNELVVLDEYFEKVDSRIISEYNAIQIKEILYQNGHVFLFTMGSYDSPLEDMIIVYDTDKKNVQNLVCISSSDVQANYSGLGRQFAVFCNRNRIIFSLNGGNGTLYQIDSKNILVEENEQEHVESLPILYKKYIDNKGNVTFEEKKDGSEQLDFLIKLESNNKEKQEKNYGKIIWGKIKA